MPEPVNTMSLDALFRQHHRELNRFAYSRLGCPEDAADVVQDAFVRYATAQQKNPASPTIETPRFFLSRIVTNLIIDRVRRIQRRGIHCSVNDDGEDIIGQIIDPQPSPCQIIESRQQLKLLTSALDELPEQCRTALLLNRIEGKTHKQIAEYLGVSSSMVSKYIMHALKHCAKRLGLMAAL